MLASLAAAVMLNAASQSVPLYLELDGAYYSIEPGGVVEYVNDGWVVTQTSMAGCDRRDGSVQQYSHLALFYGPNLDVVYLAGSTYSCFGDTADRACALAMTSTTGDIVCAGAVAAPDAIFADGFEQP